MPYENSTFSSVFLDSQRLIGDPNLDQILSKLFSTPEGKRNLMIWLSELNFNKEISFPTNLINKIHQSQIINLIRVPNWVDPQKLEIARDFFVKNAPWIMNLLGLLSLPYCYAAEKGSRVLCFTERLSKEPALRLRETAEFVWEMMDPKAFEPENKGLVSILKVRLIHSAVRHYILQDPNWKHEWGTPINQEDMAGTNLSFSLVILRGLRKMGISSSAKEQAAFLHLWNVVGYLLGLEMPLIPNKVEETIHLEKSIRVRHFKESDHGKELTKKLLDYFHTLPVDPNKPTVYIENWMNDLMGDHVSGILGIKRESKLGFPLKMISFFNQIGILDSGKKRASFQSRYQAYQNQGKPGDNPNFNWKDYSLYPLPEGVKFSTHKM